jgi:hypothetical protein
MWFAKVFISKVPKRWWVLLAGALLILLVVLLFPFQSTTVPRWGVHVVNEAGAQVSGIKVTEHWQHYLLEAEGHEEVQQTDASGRADFPERNIRASVASRLVRRVATFFRQGEQARSDPYASIVVWGSRDYAPAVATYEPGTVPQSEIVVRR